MHMRLFALCVHSDVLNYTQICVEQTLSSRTQMRATLSTWTHFSTLKMRISISCVPGWGSVGITV